MIQNCKKASEILNTFFTEFCSDKTQSQFLQEWEHIVGEKIAAHSKIIDIENNILIIEVDHPGWSQQVKLKKRQILSAVAKAYPELQLQNILIRVASTGV